MVAPMPTPMRMSLMDQGLEERLDAIVLCLFLCALWAASVIWLAPSTGNEASWSEWIAAVVVGTLLSAILALPVGFFFVVLWQVSLELIEAARALRDWLRYRRGSA